MRWPVGRWWIVKAAAWPREHLDLCGLAVLCINADGFSTMALDNGDETPFIACSGLFRQPDRSRAMLQQAATGHLARWTCLPMNR